MAGIKFNVNENFVRVSYDFPFVEVIIYPPESVNYVNDVNKIDEYKIKIMKSGDLDVTYALDMKVVRANWKGAETKARDAVVTYFNELSKEISKMDICK